MAWALVVVEFVVAYFESRLMAHRARRAAATARIGEDRKNMVKQPITSHRILYGQALISGPALWALLVEVVIDYIAYIYVAAVFIYSNNQSRLMAHRARRAGAAARIGEDRKNMVKQPITSHRILYGQALISGPI